MHDRLGMNQYIKTARVNAKNVICLNDLQAFVRG